MIKINSLIQKKLFFVILTSWHEKTPWWHKNK